MFSGCKNSRSVLADESAYSCDLGRAFITGTNLCSSRRDVREKRYATISRAGGARGRNARDAHARASCVRGDACKSEGGG